MKRLVLLAMLAVAGCSTNHELAEAKAAVPSERRSLDLDERRPGEACRGCRPMNQISAIEAAPPVHNLPAHFADVASFQVSRARRDRWLMRVSLGVAGIEFAIIGALAVEC
jgi:hypothetical protein